MKRLIVCADGTWNSDDAPEPKRTNVYKLYKAIAEVDAAGVAQKVCYQDGVGVEGSRFDQLVGGALGRGLSENILKCYRFLSLNYAPGDELFLFGFSRGAYTARSLAGLIRNSGIVRGEGLDERTLAALEEQAYELYRDRGADTHPNGPASVQFRARHAHDVPSIKCVGVWDTVGSLGMPTNGLLGKLSRERYGFHDVALSGRIQNAFHALAIDERRRPFAPSLWTVDTPNGQQRVEQVWFAGVHSNVGGGYEDCGLSDHALLWMMERAAECGLGLTATARAAIKASHEGVLYDSMSRAYRALGAHERVVGAGPSESVHESVWKRLTLPPAGSYAPRNLLAYMRAMEQAAPAAPAAPAGAAGSTT